MSERHTSKKMTRQAVIRFFVCLLVAFFLWFYVMYTEKPEYDQKYTDIRVELRGYTQSYEHDIDFPKTIDAVFRGTNIDLAECKSEDIVAVIHFPTEFTSSGERSVAVSFEFLSDVSLTPLKEIRTTISMTDADIREEVFLNVPIVVTGQAGTPQIENFHFEALSLPELTVRGRVEDLELLRTQGITATVELDSVLINSIRDKVTDHQTHEFSADVNVTLPSDKMECWTTLESTVINTTLLVHNPDAEIPTEGEAGNIDEQALPLEEAAS